MRMINCVKQIYKETLPMKLVSFSDSTASVISNNTIEIKRSSSDCILYKKQQRRIYEIKSTSDIILAQQLEIKKLQSQVNKLQDEKSVLVKWVEFLF